MVCGWNWNLATSFVEGVEDKKIKSLHLLDADGEQFQKRETVFNQVNLSDHKTSYIKSMIEADFKNQKGEGSPHWVEQTLLSQLHYCKFITNLHEELGRIQSGANQHRLVRHHS